MKHIVGIGFFIAGLAAVVFLSAHARRASGGTEVHAEPAARRDLAKLVKASGEIDPKEQLNISTHVVGKIQKLYFKEGDDLRAGQAFLELEKYAFVTQRDQWQAQLEAARTAVKLAEVDLAQADIKLARAKRLGAEGILTAEQLETAQFQWQSAQLHLESAREAVRQDQANLEKAKDDLAKTTIYSPLTGRIIKLSAKEGEVVVSGTMNNPASVIATVADLSEIEAKVNVDENDIVDVALGQTAELHVDALPARTYAGRVVEIGSSGFTRSEQPDVTFFQVKVRFEKPDEALRPGMSVRADIHTAAHPATLCVPIQAVVERSTQDAEPAGKSAAGAGDKPRPQERFKVVFVIEKGKASQRRVTTGIADETQVEVLAGLTVGSQVVTGPYRALRDLQDGQSVTVLPPEAESGGGGRGEPPARAARQR